MSNIYGILNLAGNALMTHQQAINVTGNNIANVNTPGYSRQRVLLANNVVQNLAFGVIGSGVTSLGVERIYDRFVGIQINSESENLGRWEAEKQSLEGVEAVFNETAGYGLSQAMSEFWNAWQDLSNEPSGATERTILLSKAESLVQSFSQKYQDLRAAQEGIDANIKGAVDEINQLASQIADLNQKIIETEADGQTANDYRDQRDLALRELSGLIDIATFEDENGAVKVSINNGRTLVEGNAFRRLLVQDNPSGLSDIYYQALDGSTVDITNSISNGKMKGWLEARDSHIAGYISRLDNLAQRIMEEVNTLHSAGWGLDGSTLNDFFSGTDITDMQVNIDLVNDSRLIAAASDSASIPGDASNAIAIANLKSMLTMGTGPDSTFDEFYHSLVSDVGNEVVNAGAYYHHQSDMVAYLDNYRESVSGVSLDEEMVNLVKFQSAYDASAKLISTTNELIQTVLNML
jgi:flagellar hook-associated protein 1 FlgK